MCHANLHSICALELWLKFWAAGKSWPFLTRFCFCISVQLWFFIKKSASFWLILNATVFFFFSNFGVYRSCDISNLFSHIVTHVQMCTHTWHSNLEDFPIVIDRRRGTFKCIKAAHKATDCSQLRWVLVCCPVSSPDCLKTIQFWFVRVQSHVFSCSTSLVGAFENHAKHGVRWNESCWSIGWHLSGA